MIPTVINFRNLLIFSGFLFVLFAFFVLLPKSAYANHASDPTLGYGWTNVYSTTDDCAGTGKSNVTIIARSDSSFEDRYGTLFVFVTLNIRRIDNPNVLVYSQTTFDVRDRAKDMATRINRENRMEGQAYVLSENNRFRISMGNFTDLARAKIVKDALNQRLQGQVNFTTRIRKFPYTLKLIVAGNFTSRGQARSARERLVKADPRFSDSYVVRK